MDDKSKLSDGYHTFEELYEHRNLLFLCLCRALSHHLDFYKSVDPNARGWFIVYLIFSSGQISYHLPDKYWKYLDDVDEVEYGSIYDDHTSKDVLEILEHFFVEGF